MYKTKCIGRLSRKIIPLCSNGYRSINDSPDQTQWNRSNQTLGTLQAVSFFVALCSGFMLNKKKEDEVITGLHNYKFPLHVKCADYFKSSAVKNRQESIKSLEVIADVAQETQPAVVSITTPG